MAQEDMAYWAMWMFIAALLTFVVTSIGTFLIWRQVRLTRQAVEDTSEATEAMREANRIAGDTAERQLRAYLTVEPGGINVPAKGLHRVPLNLRNSGQTPAYDLEHGGDFLIITGDPRQFNPERDGRLGNLKATDYVATTDAILGPGTNRFSYAYLEEDMAKPWWDRIFKEEAAIIHYGFFRYKDAFGVQRQTNYAFYHWSDDLSDLNSKRCRFGNDAT